VYGLHTAIATYDAIIHSGRNSRSQKAHGSASAGVGVGMLGAPVTTSTAAIASSGGFNMPWLDHAVTVRIDIHPDGRIVYAEDEQLPGRSAAWLSLDGICYLVSSSTTTTTTTTTTSAPTTSREERGLVLDRKVDLNGTLFRWNGSEVSDHVGTIQNDIDSSRALVHGSVGNLYLIL